MNTLNKWLTVSVANPDDARRRKLLNISLLGISVLVVVGLVWTLLDYDIFDPKVLRVEVFPVLGGGIFMLIGSAVVYWINRYKSGFVASSMFLLFLIVAISATDSPEQVTAGRGVSLFAIPIVMASFLLPSWAGFLAATISGVVISLISLTVLQLAPPWSSLIATYGIALVSWLSARGLEQALSNLRILNRELDQRVEERTRDLSAALQREQVEASKNQAILSSIADGVIVFDNDNMAIVANPAVAGLLSRSSDAIIDHEITDLMSDVVDIEDQESILSLLREKEKQYPQRLQWGEKSLTVNVAPVYDEAEHISGSVAVFRDFTREAELERLKSIFVSIVSHELRTPLNAIMGFAYMIGNGIYGAVSDKQKSILDRVMHNTQHLLVLVNDLLDQAQIEAGTLSLSFMPHSPAEILDDTKSMMGVLAQNKGLELVTQIDDNVPAQIDCDRQRMQQILFNLINNAIKFTEEGQIGVHIVCPDQDYWDIHISDTGPGISKEAQKYIFEPFRRIDNTITRRQEGAGLGLSIVHQLVKLMEGTISISSELGKGSTFSIRLPLVPPQSIEEEKTE